MLIRTKYIGAVGALGFAALLSACGGEKGVGVSVSNDMQTPKEASSPAISYAEKGDFDADINNFTDAEWLYQNYVGEYGAPPELKELIISEFKLIANGFALQFATGQNVEETIGTFNTFMTLMNVSGELAGVVQSLSATASSSLNNDDGNESGLDESGLDEEDFVDLIISPDAQARIDEANAMADAVKQRQIDEVHQYDLPYLLEDKDIQYYDFSQGMGKLKPGHNLNDPPPTPPPANETVVTQFSGLNRFDWYDGDIVWSDNNKDWVNHAGIVSRTDLALKQVIDAAPGNPNGGVYRHTAGLDNWIKETCPACMRVEAHTIVGGNGQRIARDAAITVDFIGIAGTEQRQVRPQVVSWATQAIGKPYNSNFANKNTTDAYYCSQLVWHAWNSAIGPLVQMDFGRYPSSTSGWLTPNVSTHVTVTPNDLRSSSRTQMFNAQVKRT